MEKAKYTTAQGLEVERLLNAIESVPKEKQPIMAVLAEALTLGERVKAIRKEKGLTQQEFGDLIGIKRNADRAAEPPPTLHLEN